MQTGFIGVNYAASLARPALDTSRNRLRPSGLLAELARQISAASDSDVLAARDPCAEILLYRPTANRFAEQGLDRSMDLDYANRRLAHPHHGSYCVGDLARSLLEWARFWLAILSFQQYPNHAAEPL
jgi:hypothetical protein